MEKLEKVDPLVQPWNDDNEVYEVSTGFRLSLYNQMPNEAAAKLPYSGPMPAGRRLRLDKLSESNKLDFALETQEANAFDTDLRLHPGHRLFDPHFYSVSALSEIMGVDLSASPGWVLTEHVPGSERDVWFPGLRLFLPEGMCFDWPTLCATINAFSMAGVRAAGNRNNQ